jgi:hypothetical protein
MRTYTERQSYPRIGVFMGISRRRFLATCAAGSTTALVDSTSLAAAYCVRVHRDGTADGVSRSATGSASEAAPLRIPATMPMGSGAPLGGIGTGFVEIRADGCFYEWQIFNSGPWAMDARSTTAPPPSGPQYLQFLLRAKNDSENVGKIRRLYLRSDENNLRVRCRSPRRQILVAVPLPSGRYESALE